MKLAFTNEVGTSQFFWPELMDERYDPPGISVYEDDSGTRWFRVQQEVGEAILAEREDVVRYDPDNDTEDS